MLAWVLDLRHRAHAKVSFNLPFVFRRIFNLPFDAFSIYQSHFLPILNLSVDFRYNSVLLRKNMFQFTNLIAVRFQFTYHTSIYHPMNSLGKLKSLCLGNSTAWKIRVTVSGKLKLQSSANCNHREITIIVFFQLLVGKLKS